MCCTANHELPPPPLLQAIEALFGGHLPTAADLSDGAKRQNIQRFTGYDMETMEPVAGPEGGLRGVAERWVSHLGSGRLVCSSRSRGGRRHLRRPPAAAARGGGGGGQR